MPRACVIVLDAVGAGELPDADAYGDVGSDTLGNVARAVGGLDLPNLEALGLGNVEPLEGCPPQPGAPAIAGRLLERSKGKDTTTGHWELMGILSPNGFPTYPHGFPHDVIDPFMHKTARGVLGNRPASGTEIIQELGEQHQKTGKWIVYTSADSVFQIAAHEDTIPLEELYEGCEAARELLTGKHAVGRVIARPFTGEPGNYERTTNRHDYSLEPKRPNYLSLIRDAGHQVHGVGKIRDIFAGKDIDEAYPTRSNAEGIQMTEQLLEHLDSGLIFVNLVETDMLWGHRNDPVNFHRCLQDFDRRLPDLLAQLREGDLLIITSDHGCDPTTPSTDHSREHAMLMAYVEGRNASGRRFDGEFADVGATVNAWLGGKAPPAGNPRTAVRRAVRLDDPQLVRSEYADESRFATRAAAWAGSTGPDPRELAFEAVAEVVPQRVLEVGAGRGELAARIQDELGAEVSAVDQSERMVALTRARGVEAIVGDVQELPFADATFDCAVAAWMLYHVPDLDRGLGELARVLRPGGRLVAVTNAEVNLPELWGLFGDGSIRLHGFHAGNGAEILGRHFAKVEQRDACGTLTFPDRAAALEYVSASVTRSHLKDELPEWEGPLECTRLSVVFVAEAR